MHTQSGTDFSLALIVSLLDPCRYVGPSARGSLISPAYLDARKGIYILQLLIILSYISDLKIAQQPRTLDYNCI